MRRKREYWTSIPLIVQGAENGEEILEKWGVRPWGREFGKQLEYWGWQRVHLPEDWTILFERGSLVMLDAHGQERAEICNVLKRKKDTGALAKALNEIFAETISNGSPAKPRPERPILIIKTVLRKRESFCLGAKGPYTFWIENAYGERVHAIEDIEIANDEVETKVPELQQEIDDWLIHHYPDWSNPLAYWDAFV